MHRIIDVALRSARRFPKSGHRIVFTHVPKCAGTSVVSAVANTFHPFSRHMLDYRVAHKSGLLFAEKATKEGEIPDDLEFLQFLLGFHLSCGFRFVAGHYPVSATILDHFSGEYDFVTVLRNPIKRWKSNFAYSKKITPNGSGTAPKNSFSGSLEDEFDQISSSGHGLAMGSMITAMFAGKYPKSPSQADDLIAPALQNLSRYSLVGTAEDLDGFAKDFRKLTGKRIRISHKNRTKDRFGSSPAQSEMTEFLARSDVTARIEELCKADLSLYDQYFETSAGQSELRDGNIDQLNPLK